MPHWFSFEEWWNKYEIRPYGPIETKDVEEAYIAGFNACRDKWGGLDYEQTIEDNK